VLFEMGSKPPRSEAAKKAAKTAKKLPNEIRKRWKVKRLQEEQEDLYWSQKKMRAKEEQRRKANIRRSDEGEEDHQSRQAEEISPEDLVVIAAPSPPRVDGQRAQHGKADKSPLVIEGSNKRKKVQKITRRLSKAQQRERVDLSLH
jgi:hypothetical protein